MKPFGFSLPPRGSFYGCGDFFSFPNGPGRSLRLGPCTSHHCGPAVVSPLSDGAHQSMGGGKPGQCWGLGVGNVFLRGEVIGDLGIVVIGIFWFLGIVAFLQLYDFTSVGELEAFKGFLLRWVGMRLFVE